MLILFIGMNVMAQTTVFYETCGTTAPSTGTRPAPDAYQGWDNLNTVTFSGNVDVRSTNSHSSHVWFAANNDKNFVISGINTSGKTDLKISFKVACNDASGDASKMTLVAKDLVTSTETPITISSTPVEDRNTYVEINNLPGIPATTNLQLTFSFTAANNPTNYGYRLDDILISSGDAPVLSSNNNLATLTVTTGTLSPAFDPAQTSYSVTLPAGTTNVPDVSYTLEDAKANATATKATAIPGTTTIDVVAENGDEKTYYINFSTETPAGSWIETFEGTSDNKASYTLGEFVGVAATWNAAAVIANNDANDKKNGTRSARLRDPNSSNATSHYIEMATDKANGAGTISLYHGMYGAHTGAATWKLEVSNDGGATWNAFSQEVTAVPSTFTKISFTANVTGNIRIKITKTNPQSAGTSTVNIDDIEISDYPSTGISDNKTSQLAVHTEDGNVYLKGLGTNSNIKVYDVTGKCVYTQKANTDVTLPLVQKGVYVIQVVSGNGIQTVKVLNK